MSRVLTCLVIVLILLGGCSAPFTDGTDSEANDTATITESPPNFLIRAVGSHTVDVVIAKNDSGSAEVLFNRTHTIENGEEVRFDDTLTETTEYRVSVNVHDGESWSRTIVPSNKYVVEITSSGEIKVML